MGTTGKDLLNKLKENGWGLDRIHGSHHMMAKDGFRSVPIPIHGNKDLPKSLVAAILKQAGLKEKN